MGTYRSIQPGVALEALADPTRRAIVLALRERPRPVGEIARGLPVTRPAVSAHLRILGEAGLVTHVRQGTRNVYSLRPDGLAELRTWLDALWDDALAAFAAYVERTEPPTDGEDEP